MESDTVRTGNDRWYVTNNGVMSTAFVEFRRQDKGGKWMVMVPKIAHIADTLDEALEIIASDMDTWYTIAQAATRLVEMSVFDDLPSAQRMGNWAREGLFPGAFKLRGPGGRGGGGAWRIPAGAFPEFVERRKKQ